MAGPGRAGYCARRAGLDCTGCSPGGNRRDFIGAGGAAACAAGGTAGQPQCECLAE
uniref:twin-arginine translocation signal domain-containing protein n=1 Tax=Acidocella aquatica TaxID=1922313 RepID=UPI0038CF6203